MVNGAVPLPPPAATVTAFAWCCGETPNIIIKQIVSNPIPMVILLIIIAFEFVQQ